MSGLKRQLHEAKALRDAAREMVEDDNALLGDPIALSRANRRMKFKGTSSSPTRKRFNFFHNWG